MRLVSSNLLREDMIVGKPIYDQNGNLFINEGIPLTLEYINRILLLEIPYVYIDDELSKEVFIDNKLSNPLRVKTIMDIKKNLKDVMKNLLSKNKFKHFPVDKYYEFQKIVTDLYAHMEKSNTTFIEIHELMSKKLMFYEHALHVAVLSMAIGKILNFRKKQIIQIGIGAVLHDIGKLYIKPEIIALKNYHKKEDEKLRMKEHPTIGYDLIKNSYEIPPLVRSIVLLHHEELDGTGYPKGIDHKTLEKHTATKIVMTCNLFDQMINGKNGMPIYQALSSLKPRVDMNIYDALSQIIPPFPIGTSVLLNNGKDGVICEIDPHTKAPIIQIIDTDKNIIHINLAEERKIHIKSVFTYNS